MQNNGVECFEIIKVSAEILLSLVAIIISIIAVGQTKKQIELSNKQALFEKRLEAYSLAKGLFDTYFYLSGTFTERTNLDMNTCIVLRSLMDNESLRDAQWVVDNPLGQESSNAINFKLRLLNKLSDELFFLFEEKYVDEISRFIALYKELLMWLQRNNINSVQTKNTGFGNNYKATVEEQVLETAKLLEESYRKIRNNDIFNILYKQVKLK